MTKPEIKELQNDCGAIFVNREAADEIMFLRFAVSEKLPDYVKAWLADYDADSRRIAVNAVGFIGEDNQREYFDQMKGTTLHLVQDNTTLVALLQSDGDLSVLNGMQHAPYRNALNVLNDVSTVDMVEVVTTLHQAECIAPNSGIPLSPDPNLFGQYMRLLGLAGPTSL